MRNNNYNEAKELKAFWEENWNKTTHHNMKTKFGLKDGSRFPKDLPKEGIEEKIEFLKEYLQKTEIHEFSGAIYGDLKNLIKEKLENRRTYMKYVLPDEPIFNKPPMAEVILSETIIIYYSGYYYLCSSSRYWTHRCPSNKYRVLYKSRTPIHTKITVHGDVSMHTRGYIL